MSRLRAALHRLTGLFRTGSISREIDAELQSHIEMATDENVRAGMLPQEARRQAYLQLGGYERAREAYAAGATLPWVGALLQDLRFALRQLRKSPGFAWTAACVLGLSLAAALAVFAVVDAALVRPLPYRQPARLVALFERLPVGDRFHLSFADFQDWKERNRTLADMGVYRPERFVLTTPNGPEAVQGAAVSSGFWTSLGVQPRFGSLLQPADDRPGSERKVLLGYTTWVQRYRRDPGVVGSSVRLDKQAYRVVGVLPEGFHFAAMPVPEFWQSINGYCAENPSCYPYYGVGRLRADASIDFARQDLASLAAELAAERPASNRDRSAEVVPLEVLLFGKVRPILLALLAGAALLACIGLLNVFTLVLIRAERRRHETATRSALGATRLRLLRQFLAEGLLLAGCGGCLGVAAAHVAVTGLRRQLSATTLDRMPYLVGLQLSTHTLWLAAGVVALAACVFGAAPLLTMGPRQMVRGLLDGGRTGTRRNWRNVGAGLSVAQISLTVVLLISAGLLLESTRRFLRQDLGFTADRLSMLHVQAQGDLSDREAETLVQDVLDRVRSLPGVQSAGVSQSPPLNGSESFRMRFTHYRVAGKVDSGLGNEAVNQIISMGYFETLQVPLLRGRYFASTDRLQQRRVAIVNEAMVRANFATGEDPVGRSIVSHYDAENPLEIVGVVRNAREGGLDASDAPAVYQPYEQAPEGDFWVLIRSSASNQSVLGSAVLALRQLHRNLLIDRGRTIDEAIRSSEPSQLHQGSARIATVSGALALLLATAGLYGVIAYSVAQRTREIGIRMALGAQRSSIYRLVLGQAALLVVTGLFLGTALSFLTTRLLGSMIFRVAPWNLGVLGAVTAALSAATFSASFLPARRAALIEPTESLRAI